MIQHKLAPYPLTPRWSDEVRAALTWFALGDMSDKIWWDIIDSGIYPKADEDRLYALAKRIDEEMFFFIEKYGKPEVKNS